jgi:hypothetical protein
MPGRSVRGSPDRGMFAFFALFAFPAFPRIEPNGVLTRSGVKHLRGFAFLLIPVESKRWCQRHAQATCCRSTSQTAPGPNLSSSRDRWAPFRPEATDSPLFQNPLVWQAPKSLFSGDRLMGVSLFEKHMIMERRCAGGGSSDSRGENPRAQKRDSAGNPT